MLEHGFGKADISVYEPGMCMMGWGMRYNRAEGVAHPLFARAAVISDPATGAKVALVSLELLLVSQSLRLGVLDKLAEAHPERGFGPDNVVMAATHTHSGPSGFSHYMWINLASPGYSQLVYEHIRDAVVDAIVEADRRRVAGPVRMVRGTLSTDEGVAFNRSWFAYNRNRDVTPVSFDDRHLATDREMTLLAFEDGQTGRVHGVWTWFATHGTCVHAENKLLHPDHKGLAAAAIEAELGEGAVAVFAQEATGDVSPNFRWSAERKKNIGRYDDDFESAEFVAAAQARFALQLLAEARAGGGVEIEAPLELVTRYVDYSDTPAAPAFSPDGRPRRTRRAVVGVSMAEGTAEGPGPMRTKRWLSQALSRVVSGADLVRSLRPGHERRHDPKFPLLDLGLGLEGRLLGLFGLRQFRLPAPDPTFAYVKGLVKGGAVGEGPWIPQIIPLQLVRIGPLAIAAAPFELTTVAGRRLRATVQGALAERGVQHVVANTYSNAYVGYMTTFEEYQVQHYEAGYTLFGPFSLAALRTAYADLSGLLGRGPTLEPGPTPYRFPPEEVAARPFEKPWS